MLNFLIWNVWADIFRPNVPPKISVGTAIRRPQVTFMPKLADDQWSSLRLFRADDIRPYRFICCQRFQTSSDCASSMPLQAEIGGRPMVVPTIISGG
jgi:hypothetical protein